MTLDHLAFSLLVVALWYAFGCIALVAFDDRDASLWKWCRACPMPGGFTLCVLCWPFVLARWKQ